MDLIAEHEDWHGWRVSGRWLIHPTGQRIPIERLRGLLWRDELELRRSGYESRRRATQGRTGAAYGPRVKVVVIDLTTLGVSRDTCKNSAQTLFYRPISSA